MIIPFVDIFVIHHTNQSHDQYEYQVTNIYWVYIFKKIFSFPSPWFSFIFLKAKISLVNIIIWLFNSKLSRYGEYEKLKFDNFYFNKFFFQNSNIILFLFKSSSKKLTKLLILVSSSVIIIILLLLLNSFIQNCTKLLILLIFSEF